MRKAYLALIKAYQGGWDAMAAALGLSRMALENRIYERKGQTVTVEIALAMQSFSGTTLFAEEVARESGGVFIAIPEFNGVSDIELLDAYTAMVQAEGKFAEDFRAAIRDGIIIPEEFALLKKDMQQKQAHEMELLARIESMVVVSKTGK